MGVLLQFSLCKQVRRTLYTRKQNTRHSLTVQPGVEGLDGSALSLDRASRYMSVMIASCASVLCVPTSVDRRYDNVLEVFVGDSADEEDLVVVLDRHKLRVVYSGLHHQSLVG